MYGELPALLGRLAALSGASREKPPHWDTRPYAMVWRALSLCPWRDREHGLVALDAGEALCEISVETVGHAAHETGTGWRPERSSVVSEKLKQP